MANWKIKVFSPTGTVKTEYTNVSPGGIVSSIAFELEPSGNCLSGSFEGIPDQLNIGARDLIQIEIENVNRFFGYVSSIPNVNSKYPDTYELEGTKKLYYETLLNRFWYQPGQNTEPGAYVGDLVKHSYIVAKLHEFRPGFISATMLNGASTTSGNKPPIIAQDYSLGEIMDAIIYSSADDEVYHWGVNGNGQFFVMKESDTTPINLTFEDRQVELTSQDIDDTKTAVKFVFSIPENYYHPQLKTLSNVTTGTRTNTAADVKKEITKFAPISYEYVDTVAAAEYGKVTTVVPLILSDTWMKLVSWTDAATQNGITLEYDDTNYSWMWNDMRTQANSSLRSAQMTAISTRGTSTYIQNNVAIVGPRGLQLELRNGSTSTLDEPTGIVPEDIGLIGFYYRISAIPNNGEKPLTWYQYNVYAKPVATTDEPRFDYIHYFPPEDNDFTYTDVSIYSLITKPALNEWEVDPEGINSAGFKKGDYRKFSQHIWFPSLIPSPLIPGSYTVGGNLAIGDFKVYEWFCLFLNTEALDSYAKTFITLPSDYPSQVTTKEDFGLSYELTLSAMLTVNVVKVSYELSVNRGFVVTYTTGKDPDRSNKFLTRLMARDYAARNSAYFLSQAG